MWTYRGKNQYITSCPHCKTTLMIRKHKLPQQQGDSMGYQPTSKPIAVASLTKTTTLEEDGFS
jgi:hypothetical protein